MNESLLECLRASYLGDQQGRALFEVVKDARFAFRANTLRRHTSAPRVRLPDRAAGRGSEDQHSFVDLGCAVTRQVRDEGLGQRHCASCDASNTNVEVELAVDLLHAPHDLKRRRRESASRARIARRGWCGKLKTGIQPLESYLHSCTRQKASNPA